MIRQLEQVLKYNFRGYFSKKGKEEYKQLLRRSLSRISDRGYVDEEMAREATYAMYNYLDKIKDCIKENNIQEGIHVIQAALEVIGEFYIDDSYGDVWDIGDEFTEVMELLLEKCLADEKKEFLEWLKCYNKKHDHFIDYKDGFEKIYNEYMTSK